MVCQTQSPLVSSFFSPSQQQSVRGNHLTPFLKTKIPPPPPLLSLAKQLLDRCDKQQLMQMYDLQPFDNHIEFLGQFARKRGKLGRGGIADMNAAAKAIVKDWTSGKIPAWAVPPEIKAEVTCSCFVVVLPHFASICVCFACCLCITLRKRFLYFSVWLSLLFSIIIIIDRGRDAASDYCG